MKSALVLLFVFPVLGQSIRAPFQSVLSSFPSTQPENAFEFSVIDSYPRVRNTFQNYQIEGERLVQVPFSLFSRHIPNYEGENFYQAFGLSSHTDSIVKLKKIQRKLDGTQNNVQNPLWGSTGIPLQRNCPALYADQISKPMPSIKSPRQISNIVGRLDGPLQTSRLNITMMFVIWGQFLDHDISLTEVNHNQKMAIVIPECDEFMDPECQGDKVIPFERSIHEQEENPRDQLNSITAWLDASQIYGSSESVAHKLRSFSLGRLRTEGNNLLPLVENDHHHSRDAGDVRANQNIMLLSFHTIFMREHNRVCEEIVKKTAGLTQQQIYHAAKNYVTGLVQKISFYDFLPLMIGQSKFDSIIGQYKGYDRTINPNIQTQFSTAAFRIGHSLLVSKYKLLNRYSQTQQMLSLNQMFFNPNFLSHENIDKILRGLASTLMKEKSVEIIDEIRNLLIQGPAHRHINLDLYALNIQRAKDHGIDNYNSVRKSYGLEEAQTFEEISSDSQTVEKLKQVYENPSKCDTWVCILAEDSLEGAVVGELAATIIATTFKKLRDGDGFWYEHAYPQSVMAEIDSTTFSDIILRNTGIGTLERNAFKLI